MSSIELYRIKKRIEEAINILIVSHHDPDGDALGSSLGLGSFLNSIGKKTIVYNRDKCPDYLNFIDSFDPENNRIKGIYHHDNHQTLNQNVVG